MNTTVQNISTPISRVNKGYSFLTLLVQLFFGFLFLIAFGLKVGAQTCPSNISFTIQPASQTDCKGNSVDFEATISSGAVLPVTFTWQRSKPSDGGVFT